MRKILLYTLFFLTVRLSVGQNPVYLIEKNTGNPLLELPVSTKIDGDILYIIIGNEKRVKDIYGREVMFWIFYEEMSFKELEEINPKIYLSSGIKDEINSEGFFPVISENLTLETKSKYDNRNNRLTLNFKITDPALPSSIKLFFYLSDIAVAKKKDIRFFAIAEPYIIQIEATKEKEEIASQGGNGQQGIVLTPGAYTDPEQMEAVAYERFKKNLALYVEEAAKKLEKAQTEHSQGNDISGYVNEVEVIKNDINFDKEDFRAQIRDDEAVRANLKRFESIHMELNTLSQKPLPTLTNSKLKIKKEHIMLILMGVGGMLFIMIFNNIMVSIKNKKQEKKMERQRKKQEEEDRKKEEEENNPPPKKIRIRI